MLSVVKMLLKGEVGGCALNSHGNYIVDHRISWKNHRLVFLNFCGNLDTGFKDEIEATEGTLQIFALLLSPPTHHLGLVVTKPVFGVSEKARLKPVSSATETS